MSCVPTSIEEQYENHLYSDFVEAPDQKLLYSAYYHYSLFHLLHPVLTSKVVNLRVMDLACGNAIIGRKIKKINPSVSVVGIDQSEAMLCEAQRLVESDEVAENFSLLNCDVKDIPQDIDHLLPGGLTVHIIPEVDNMVPEGKAEKVEIELHQKDTETKSIILYDFHWLERTYRNAATTSGLIEVRIQPGAICPRGEEMGLPNPLPGKILILSARKPP